MRKLLHCVLVAATTFGSFGYAQQNGNGANNSTATTAGESIVQPAVTSPSVILSATSTLGNGTCASRTANYITHTLAQQCLRTDRVHPNTTRTSESPIDGTPTPHDSVGSSGATSTLAASSSEVASVGAVASSSATGRPASAESSHSAASTSQTTIDTTVSAQDQVESDSPLDNANFLSFEEWKKLAVAKYRKQGNDLRERTERQRPGINNALDGFGEDGEIELDFSGFGSTADAPKQAAPASREAKDTKAGQKAPTAQSARSKDAGKTCKERTNYASFDCSATVLKNNPECKSASSVLVENKDSYMLNTCSVQNKFFIVELCDVILIDTVVLANYEFFSSIFRHFRVSASTTYPAATDKWKDLGTFEARNTREVQAFLIEYPQIWAKYLRIEFLTHYGSEYYCPVSLLRVHGTNMLEEEFRAQEEIPPVEPSDEAIVEAEMEIMPTVPIAQEPANLTDESVKGTIQAISSTDTASLSATTSQGNSSATSASSSTESEVKGLKKDLIDPQSIQNFTSAILELLATNVTNSTCTSSATNRSETTTSAKSEVEDTSGSEDVSSSISDGSSNQTSTAGSSTTQSASENNETSSVETTQTSSPATANEPTSNSTLAKGTQSGIADVSSRSSSAPSDTSVSIEVGQSSTSTNSTSRAPSATAPIPAQPQPSTQDSFFKSIHKRLQQLESNSTLSLQYIEEQSRILRDAFSKVEKRQISATTSFLANLNQTVMTELHGFRQAYDQLWQSTVIELEGQREQYQREMLALSSRLTLVADELVWQKRMGIIQSTLLLLCLGLVLFARGGSTGYLEVPLMQQMMSKSTAAFGRGGWESPPASPSPESRSPVRLLRRKLWRSVTDPAGGSNATDGTASGTDSRPESKEGPTTLRFPVDVNVEPPTPPRETSGSNNVEWDDVDDEDVLDPRESQSGPATPRGTREKESGGDGYLDAG